MAAEEASRAKHSPFFYTGATAEDADLAILHLKRDSLLPVQLRASADDGYAEGAVTNTRFGSFPHSTLIGLEWGRQVRASKVDTGTRGRKGKKGKHGDTGTVADSNEAPAAVVCDVSEVREKDARKRESDSPETPVPAKKLKQQCAETSSKEKGPTVATKAPIEAGSGFVHLLPPTPESWTSSLDHRTQVVYTPDSSYILQRLRVKPGSAVIEAGAGSGSFTHAAARAVFSGFPSDSLLEKKNRKVGRVYSYEFHAPRVETLQQEVTEHGLDGVVRLTRRDVCTDGFMLPDATSPNADAIFLDLPAPWLALRHLHRSQPNSALNPESPVHLCTFSPCIEQVMATVSHLRSEGWIEIKMVEVQNRRVDVRREQVGLKYEGLRGVNASAATVTESISRLREVEQKLGNFHASKGNSGGSGAAPQDKADGVGRAEGKKGRSKQERLERIKKEAEDRKLYVEGNLVHRTEPEVKTHTSYLVFAILPQDSTEDETEV